MDELALYFFLLAPLHDVEAVDCLWLCVLPSASKLEIQDKYTWKYG